jgi:hypothetical protein
MMKLDRGLVFLLRLYQERWVLSDNETIYFQSEVTGILSLYSYNLKTKKKTNLQKEWEVRDVNLQR